MKSLVIWASGVVVAFAALAGVTSATRDTEQVFVVVDTSFGMDGLLSRVPAELDQIEDREHAEFALATVRDATKQLVHGYQSEFDGFADNGFDLCSFDNIDSFPEASTADERILITSVESCSTTELDGWTVIEIDG